MKKIIVISIISFVFLGIANFALASTLSVDSQENEIKIHFFYGNGCPNCKKAESFLNKLEQEYPLEIHSYEVYNSRENAKLLSDLFENCGKNKSIRVPAVFIGEKIIIGYLNDERTGQDIKQAIETYSNKACPDPLDKLKKCECQKEEKQDEIISYPFIGHINLSKLSLPVLTVALAALDGFNPCAMWMLLFLLALLINIQSRKRIWLIAGTFILVSGIVYYLLLSAWLNIFLAIGYVTLTRIIIGIVALSLGVWQIKRFITFKPGVCEIAPDGSQIKNKFQTHTEKIVNNPVLIFSILGIIVLAFAVNLIEFFCSAGLPAIYANILSLSQLSSVSYYLYLLLYTFIFMLDDLIIFSIALITLNKIGFTDKYTKWSTLIGGLLILILGFLLIFRPDFLIFG